MGQYFDQIPAALQNHVKGLVKSVKVDEGTDALEVVSQAWLEKKAVFEDKIGAMNMEEVNDLSADDAKGALALTYSGSLVNIGPLVDGVRTVEDRLPDQHPGKRGERKIQAHERRGRGQHHQLRGRPGQEHVADLQDRGLQGRGPLPRGGAPNHLRHGHHDRRGIMRRRKM